MLRVLNERGRSAWELHGPYERDVESVAAIADVIGPGTWWVDTDRLTAETWRYHEEVVGG